MASWVIKMPDGSLFFGRPHNRVQTVSEHYPRYAARFSQKLAKRIAREVGGDAVKVEGKKSETALE